MKAIVVKSENKNTGKVILEVGAPTQSDMYPE